MFLPRSGWRHTLPLSCARRDRYSLDFRDDRQLRANAAAARRQFFAYGVTEYLKDIPIYEALLERDLARAGISSGHAEPIIVEFEVEPNSHFAGLLVRDLGCRPAA